MLHFECPSCKAKCESAESTAGMTIACPHCGKPALVPTQSTAGGAGGVQFRNIVLVIAGLIVVGFVVMMLNPSGLSGGGPNPVVVMQTSMGTIKIELYADKAPISTENFLKYVDANHYDGTIFHRVIESFMIQGGGFLPGMRERGAKFPPIKNEAGNGLSNERGTIAMARTNDPDSATDQFFINVVNNKGSLDRKVGSAGYAVFGKVIDGMDVVDRIREVPTRNVGGHEAVPVNDVLIKSVRHAEPKSEKGTK